MGNSIKRFLALMLALVMVFGMMPTNLVLAEEVVDNEEIVADEEVVVNEEEVVVDEEIVEDEEVVADEEEAPVADEEAEEPALPEQIDLSAPEADVEPAADSGAVKVEHNGETTYYASLQKAFDGFAPSNNTYGGTYVVTLLEDVSGNLYKVLSYPTEVLDVTLDLNGHTITGDGTTVAVVFNLGSNLAKGSVVTIKDSSGTNAGKITGGKGGVKLDGTDCTLRFEGGTITGNHGGSKGGGIFMGAKSKLIMTGGIITGNSVIGTSSSNTGYGGGVLANYADILGGVITGNTAYKGSHLQTGRGGGVCTEITRTSGYNVLNIAPGVVYGNTAENAGDDIMAQGNGSAKFTLTGIGTENWFVDGWNGKKATSGGGQTERYNAENPVPYTDGGFSGTDGNGAKDKTIGLKYVVSAPAVTEYTVTYTDGVEGEEIFADQVYTVKEGDATPAFNGTPAREGYTFAGWEPAVAETVTADATYAAQWEAIPEYTVTYTDGVEDEEIFADQVYTVEEGEATPAFDGTPAREGYKFLGWEPAVAETVTGNVTYVAQWEKIVVYVAELNGVQYETLQAALDATKTYLEGDADEAKITLLNNTTECVKLSWSRLKGIMTLTIDLNGFTVTGNGSNSVMVFSGLSSGSGRYNIVINDSSEAQTGTITGGYATSGGAIKLDNAKAGDSLTVNGGNFVKNTATSSGGALYATVVGADIVINGGCFDGNTAKSGGAISAYSLTVNGGIFQNNTATGDTQFSGRGGAIAMWGTVALDLDVTGGKFINNSASRYGDDIVFCSTNKNTASMKLMNAADMGVEGVDGWYIDGYYGNYTNEALLSERFGENNAVEFEDYADFGGNDAKGIAVALKAAAKPLPAIPALPEDNGSNVTAELITIVCDTDEGHTSKTYGWGDPAANIVFPKGSKPVWNEELNAWTIGVRIDSIQTSYVGLRFNDTCNGIQHEVVMGEPLTSDEYKRIDTTLVWNAGSMKWQTLTGEPFEVHVTCQTAPEAPQMGYHLGKFQIKMVGNVNGEEKIWHEFLHAETVTVGEVYGDRTEGFFADVTVTLDDNYLAAWVAKHASGKEYTYADGTPATVTLTMKYTGDTTGELYDGPEYWAAAEGNVYTVNVVRVAPAAPTKYGANVTPNLVRVICDSDPNHAPLNVAWQFQSTEVRDWVSGVVWSEEDNTWIVPVRIDGIINYYVWLNFEKVYNDILHPLADESQEYIDTYLKWDETQQLWVTMDEKPIEVHVTCKTQPDAPEYIQLKSYQVKVQGEVNGGMMNYTTSIPENGYTLSEVRGSREEGFFVDVTVALEDGDAYITTWIDQRAPGQEYVYDWSKTPQTVTFTLKYNGSLTGNLYGHRHASNTNYDWVLESNGKTYGAVLQAYVKAKVYVAQIGETKYETLTEAIAAVQNGETIELLTDTDEKVTIKQVSGKSFTIDGAGKTYSGTITVDGNKRSTGKETLTIKNVNFVATAYGQASITTPKNQYAHNITVDSCTFTGTGEAEYATYGIYLRHSYNIVVKNTTASKMVDLVYGNTAVTGFTAENVTITDSVQGIWLSYPTGTITLTNVTTTNSGNVGVGFYNNAQGTVTFENCNIDKIAYTEKGTKALTLVFMDGNNVLETGETNSYLTVYLNGVNATVKASEALNVKTDLEGYKAVHKDGIWSVQEEKGLFGFYGTNVNLGNNLDMQFAFSQNEVEDWTGYYVEMVRTYSMDKDGNIADNNVVRVDYEDWVKSGSFYVVTYGGLAAKEMCDEVTVTVYDANGKAVSVDYTDSMRAYAMRKYDVASTVFTDMLNYGAAAQMHFTYGVVDLANSQLSEAQRANASELNAITNNQVKDDKFYGSNLIIKSNIQFQFAFSGITDEMYAVATFTGWKNNEEKVDIPAGGFAKSGSYHVVTLENMVVADARCMITIIVYNADGTVYTTVQESIESYIARNIDKAEVFGAFMKFADTAREYLESK